jgi:hypothetical protein
MNTNWDWIIVHQKSSPPEKILLDSKTETLGNYKFKITRLQIIACFSHTRPRNPVMPAQRVFIHIGPEVTQAQRAG